MSIHTPEYILQSLLDNVLLDTKTCQMFRGEIFDSFYSIDSSLQTVFQPLLSKVKDLTPYTTTSDIIHRCRLLALDSQEIQLSGHKLSSSSTPMELDAFLDSMGRAVSSRTNWDRLLLIKVPSRANPYKTNQKAYTMKSILHDFRTIPESAVLSTNFHRSESLADASLSMYEAITSSMTVQFRGEMRLYRDKINNMGPKLFYFILRKLKQKDSHIIADLQLSLTTFEKAFKNTGYDIHLVCPVLFD